MAGWLLWLSIEFGFRCPCGYSGTITMAAKARVFNLVRPDAGKEKAAEAASSILLLLLFSVLVVIVGKAPMTRDAAFILCSPEPVKRARSGSRQVSVLN